MTADLRRLAWYLPSALAALVTRGVYARPPHLALLERKLLDVATGRCKRLMVSCPPRHGKSETCSRFFPAWFLALNPHKRVILTSYEAEFAASWGRKARDVLTEWGPELYGVKVRQDLSAANRWEIETHGGGMVTAGVGGPITGRGADLLIVDDPVKNAEEASSETLREKAWDWWRSTAYTRLEPGAACLVIMTRWNEDDLAGRLLQDAATGGEQWETLVLPALAEPGDRLNRAPGEALWPERYDAGTLEVMRRSMGSYLWSALYQQRPAPLGGGLFKIAAARRYRWDGPGIPMQGEYVFRDDGSYATAENMDRFVTVDTATSKDPDADHTSIAAWGVDPRGRLCLLDLDLRRIEGPEIMRSIVKMCARWETVSYIEENATSKHLLSFMEASGIPFRLLKPGAQNKFTRALPASALWEQGKVVLPEDAPYLPAVERQLVRFRGVDGDEDDFVDCLAYAARVMLEEIASAAPEPIPNVKPRTYLPPGFGVARPRGF